MTEKPTTDPATSELLLRLEAFFDAVPRQGARAEPIGPLVLFVREGPGWPYYARPVRPDVEVSADDVRAVLDRMAELGVPQQLEWVHDLTPSLTEAAQEAGLPVQRCPLMVLEPADLVVPEVAGVGVQVMAADDPDLARAEACAHVAFGAGIGTAVGDGAVAERDAAADALDPARLERLREGIRTGEQVRAVARTGDGAVAAGGYQHAAGVAEVVGIGTLPAYRRRGIGAAIAGVLAREAFERGEHTVFLSAADEAVARVYDRVGFRRLGTSGIAQT